MSRQAQKISKGNLQKEVKRFNNNLNKMDILLSQKETKRWANFDTTTFPIVRVTMNRTIDSDEEFTKFLEDWEDLYLKNQKFTLFFDTTNVGFVSMKYAFRMRSFVRRLKTQFPDLLEKSLIKVNSSWVKFLLRVIFTFERPVADVYVHSGNEETVNFNIENSRITPPGVTRFRK